MLERNITGDFAEKINQIGDSIKKAQQAAREQDLEKLKNYKYNYVNLITQNQNLFGSQPHLMADIVNDLEKALHADSRNPESDFVGAVLGKIEKFTSVVRNEMINK